MDNNPDSTEQSGEPDARKLDRFVAGDLPEVESARIVAWAQSQPAWDSNALWERIKPELNAERTPKPQRSSARYSLRTSNLRWVPAIAAAVLVAFVGGVWTYLDRVPRPGLTVTATTYRTERGQRASFHLPDGSAIQLGPQSQLRFDSTFGVVSRTVVLEGDGYFHVSHDVARPFIVRTAQGEVRDLGTRFAIRARNDAPTVDIAVAEGVVALGRSDTTAATIVALGTDSVIVEAGEIAVMDPRGPGAPIAVRDIDRYFAWTRGQLVFDRTPLTQVITELNRWFAEDFVVGDSQMRNVRLTTVLQGETLAEAIVVLETSLDVNVARVDGKLVLRRRSTAPDSSARRRP